VTRTKSIQTRTGRFNQSRSTSNARCCKTASHKWPARYRQRPNDRRQKSTNPRLPLGEVPILVLLVDVSTSSRTPVDAVVDSIASLKPKGVIALLEYRPKDPNVPIKPLHR